MKIIAYRGQHCDYAGIRSRSGSISFTTNFSIAKKYALSPNNREDKVKDAKVYEVELRIDNPFIESKDCFLELSEVEDKLGRSEMLRIIDKFSYYIQITDNWEENFKLQYQSIEEMKNKAPDKLRELYFLAYPFFNDKEEVENLKKRGYDGATHKGSGITRDEIEYQIFDKDKISIIRSIQVKQFNAI